MKDARLPWSERQFINAMRKAGYKSLGQGCWEHKGTGKKFMAWTYENGREAWRPWAEKQQTPPPF